MVNSVPKRQMCPLFLSGYLPRSTLNRELARHHALRQMARLGTCRAVECRCPRRFSCRYTSTVGLLPPPSATLPSTSGFAFGRGLSLGYRGWGRWDSPFGIVSAMRFSCLGHRVGFFGHLGLFLALGLCLGFLSQCRNHSSLQDVFLGVAG
mgnify:CR=1 FL=1